MPRRNPNSRQNPADDKWNEFLEEWNSYWNQDENDDRNDYCQRETRVLVKA